ncbi:type III pantothenate kinase [Dichelobacter nodosus]|uniref:Type III pantothenate kinase n=1 Tax=Dichelobacter nodosus (strain VCS1703A) TaxID=246195 RepID=COAX_DICNV|nr:type III pantothenate kinase [Dichelobacter nodosus]A5EVK4.1 RecName: Full=Type III pantothenate kinase; AltName: Full=PanK-III; AltName: Full=Pantothenic acid kinase [Dichelobacter nodosus VCS1703A]ABQ13636.1 bvg accessory factor family protein [Dichelobacter nodosus VCS1703A]AXM45422.1 type III pantothenate kinase [Dichelobacter nodosus]KNZ40028.1 pantothenate kinase [Dichelobacter nodosus]TGA64964.1 type III pantothenate kinase [Dichelobacter nodosus]
MYLLIDVGNSRIKWLYGNKVPSTIEAVSYKQDWQMKLIRAWHLLPEPEAIALSSVNKAEITTTIEEIVRQLWHKTVKIFVSQKQTNHTLTVVYQKPEKLGSDRYLAMLGARSLCHDPLCVVGCGTAITLDAVDGDGRHLGGFILPGMRLAENALLQNTQKLVPMRWTPHLLGNDTASCISAGIHHALPAGVDHIIDELEGQCGYYFKRFAFGGDAQILFGNRPTYRIEPDLIFGGMFAHLSPPKQV